jgi:signal transduction histidine kinase
MLHAMELRAWFRPPRQLLLVFAGVAALSVGAVGWLGWLLFEQDVALEVQRRQERLEDAADRTASAMQRAIADLRTLTRAATPDAAAPASVAVLSIGEDAVAIRPPGRLLYHPVRATEPIPPADLFAEADSLEFVRRDFAGASRRYEALARSVDAPIRASVLSRLARVRRKAGDVSGALRAYEDLAAFDVAAVDELPAGLIARAGRASLFETLGRANELREEAQALARDLAKGRWPLLEGQYDFYSREAARWLGSERLVDRDALTLTEATAWLWQNRAALRSPDARRVAFLHGPALAVWQLEPDRIDAVIAGPAFLAALCADSIATSFRCAMSDADGRTLAGERPPARMTAVRMATSTGLPWTVHVSESADAVVSASPRRRLLLSTFAVVGVVLAAGWYFIARAMSRERRVLRLQSDFVAAVSHEFRSPLTSLAHIAELLAADRLPADEMRRSSYDVLVRETDRLRRLVEGLLDFGRFESGAASLRLETFDLAEMVRTTIADFQSLAARDGYVVTLADPGIELPVRADREALSRALWNLLDNAVKYSPDCRTVWVDVMHEDDRISVAVRDRGIGIPLREQREIFDRFVRGTESTARRIKGTGIGLAMVREIVHAHGGEIRVASEPGHGSQFTLVLQAAGGAA